MHIKPTRHPDAQRLSFRRGPEYQFPNAKPREILSPLLAHQTRANSFQHYLITERAVQATLPDDRSRRGTRARGELYSPRLRVITYRLEKEM